jgi:hypothetical protein
MRNGLGVEKFGCCGRGITIVILFGPAKEGLFEIEAFAEGGMVEMNDGD